MKKEFKNLLVYTHVYGLPDYLDSVDDELTECVWNDCDTISEAEKYVEEMTRLVPNDEYGRKVNRYIWVW